jgi:hypothetical protein
MDHAAADDTDRRVMPTGILGGMVNGVGLERRK